MSNSIVAHQSGPDNTPDPIDFLEGVLERHLRPVPARDPVIGLDQHDPATQPSLQGQRTPMVLCGWCGSFMRGGDLTLPTSHGICLPCRARVWAEWIA